MANHELLTQIVPIDLGFGYTKGKRGQKEFRQPSVVGVPRRVHEQDIKDDDYVLGHFAPVGDEKKPIFVPKHFVGNLAVRKSNVRHYSIGDDKAGTWTSEVLLSTALAELTKDKEDIFVVTGLPLDFYFKQRASMEAFLNNFNKVDSFFYKKGVGNPFQSKPVIVKSIVTLQPMGAAMKYLLDERGQIRDKKEAAGINIVGDIGFHTFDILVLDGMEIHRYSHSDKEISIANAYTVIQDWLRDEIGSAPDIYELDYHILKGHYQGIELTDKFEEAMQTLAYQAKLALDSLNLNYNKFISTGGWASVITPMMELKEETTVTYDQDGNIDGYGAIGVRACLTTT